MEKKKKASRPPQRKLKPKNLTFLKDFKFLFFRTLFVLLLFGGGFFALDRSLGWGLQAALRHVRTPRVDIGVINQALSTDANAYILGDSRAQYHYIPKILAQATGLKFFNAGLKGRELDYVRFMGDLLLQTRHPDLLLVDLSFHNFDQSRPHPLTPMLHLALPYAAVSQAMKTYPYPTLSRLSQVYGYQDLWMALGMQLRYGKSQLTWSERFQTDYLKPGRTRPLLTGDIDKRVVGELLAFIQQCHASQVRVVFCISPTYRGETEFGLWSQEIKYLNLIRQIAKLSQIPLIEVTETHYPQFRDYRYYSDPAHLNAAGALLYSQLVAEHLKIVLDLPDQAALQHSIYYPSLNPSQYLRW